VPNFPDGLYDLLITDAVARELANLTSKRDEYPLDPADADVLLAGHVARAVRAALQNVPTLDRPDKQATIANEILKALQGDAVSLPARRLAAIYPLNPLKPEPPRQPEIPLAQSDLLVNAKGEPRIGSVLEREIESADRIDLIVAFIRWSGLRLLEPKLRDFTRRGGKLRVITSTYTGSTERRAIEQLVALGAEVKVSYLTDSTRLHAKAWQFHRHSGFTTIFIGSSNLSTTAMRDGVEWNVRLSMIDAPTIVEKFAATFETYWAGEEYETYDPTRDREKFDRAVASSREDAPIHFTALDVEPFPHQREMLETLEVERYRHNRWRNLVVAATGTGKTVVAALDYRRLNDPSEPLPWPVARRPLSLLFVAHRKEILEQSLSMFRMVMRDGSFGELYVDGQRPEEWRQVFASVQSLSTLDLQSIDSQTFDVIIVDEFHHAAAPTYRKLLTHLQPKMLLGLTATPERTDGEPILEWFDGRIAVELRLWDALERGLLSPFHYFGIHDSVDLSHVAWRRGRYDDRELENVYTGNDARVLQIIAALQQKVSDLGSMRALGFCVGVGHAEFMAARFRAAGIPAEAVLGTTDSEARDRALRRLRDGEIRCLFAVDIFNEGVDVPQIDTVLFLRPTESALVFLQQLGRGLRRSRNKECLTVLDFIGNANRNFRFDLRYRAITGASRRQIEKEVEEGFPWLPAGTSIQLDRESTKVVLENLRQCLGSHRFASLVEELRRLPVDTTLARFLTESKLDPEDLYRTKGWSWTKLRRDAGRGEPEALRIADAPKRPVANPADETALLNALPRLLHYDDERRLALLRNLLARPEQPRAGELTVGDRRVVEALLLTLFSDETDFDRALQRLWQQPAVRAELLELLTILDDRAAHVTFPLATELSAATFANVPLSVHARYTREDVLSAIGLSTLDHRYTHREGPLRHEPTNTDYLFITLDKSDRAYSPSTRYRDYALSPEVFHWESQSTTPAESKTGQRYIHHQQRGSNVVLLVRSRNKEGTRTLPFTLLGPARYVEHTGSRPMSILWRLHRPMPLDLFNTARVVAG
jgi:superfamily II DNA or RNA helicase